MDVTEVYGAITAVKTAIDISRTMIGLNTAAQIKEKSASLVDALMDIQQRLMESQAAYAAVVDEVRSLKQEAMRLENWKDEKDRYQMLQTHGSVLVYALKESNANGEPPHYLCANCYSRRTKTYLTPKIDGERGFTSLYCSVCKTSAPTGFRGITMQYAI
jgi:hypothetical protein